MFISIRGLPGSSVPSDRAMEDGNNQQKERNLTTNVFDSLLFTTLLMPMMHVYRVWKDMRGLLDGADSGVRPSTHTEVSTLVAFMVQAVGTHDITQYTTHSHFYHTGNARDMRAAASMHEMRPQEWVDKTSEGKSRGYKMGQPEHWWTYILRHIRDHMFYQ